MTKEKVNAEEILIENGYEGIKYLTDFSYDTALIGVSNDNRAIYDYDLMIEWLIEDQGFTELALCGLDECGCVGATAKGAVKAGLKVKMLTDSIGRRYRTTRQSERSLFNKCHLFPNRWLLL